MGLRRVLSRMKFSKVHSRFKNAKVQFITVNILIVSIAHETNLASEQSYIIW